MRLLSFAHADFGDFFEATTRKQRNGMALLHAKGHNEGEHQGRWCYGKTPMRTFLDSLELAKEKLIPH